MKKILFVSPYSGRAGAEMYLYRLLKNYDPQHFQAMLVTEKHSPLFASLQPKVKYTSMQEHRWKKITARLKEKLCGLEKSSSFGLYLEQVHHQFQPDVWVLNSIMMEKAISTAMRVGTRVTSIIHELPSAYSLTSLHGIKSLITQSHCIISNSKQACSAISTMGRPDVKMQPCFYDPQEIKLTQPRAKLRAALGIGEHDFVLVGSGSQDYNKGLELFMQISESAKKEHLKFVWVGAERHSGFNYYLHAYREKLHENGNLIFVGEKTNDYYDFLNIADTFMLTSFNESFSLVTLEAMALGKPVIVYDCGGVNDFVSEKTGRILSTRNPEDWLNSISWVQENYNLFEPTTLIKTAHDYSTDKQIPNIVSILTDDPQYQQNPNT